MDGKYLSRVDCCNSGKGNNLCESSGAPNISPICWGLVGTYSLSDKWRSKSKVDGILSSSWETDSWDPDWSLSYVVVNSECVINCIDLGADFFDALLPVVAVCTSFEVRVVLSVVTLDVKGVCCSLASCLASLLASLLLFSSSLFILILTAFSLLLFLFSFFVLSYAFLFILFSFSVFIDSLSLMGVLLAQLLVGVLALLFLFLSHDLPCPAQKGLSGSISFSSLNLLPDTALLVFILIFIYRGTSYWVPHNILIFWF